MPQHFLTPQKEQKMKTIDKFKNEHEFLSNFYPSPITIEDITYPTVEHAFQAAKTLDHTHNHHARNNRNKIHEPNTYDTAAKHRRSNLNRRKHLERHILGRL